MIKVYTYGVFDILHPGHIRLLERAKDLGDYLIVGVVADVPVSTLKGPGRPIMPLPDRLAVVKALRCVDEVCEQETYDPLLQLIHYRPDILTKGDDWDHVPGQTDVCRFGGYFKSLPYSKEWSTTAIIKRITDNDSSVKSS